LSKKHLYGGWEEKNCIEQERKGKKKAQMIFVGGRGHQDLGSITGRTEYCQTARTAKEDKKRKSMYN